MVRLSKYERRNPGAAFSNPVYAVSRNMVFTVIIILPVDVPVICSIICVSRIGIIHGAFHPVATSCFYPAASLVSIGPVILEAIDDFIPDCLGLPELVYLADGHGLGIIIPGQASVRGPEDPPVVAGIKITVHR